ncbi:hypothetical protein LIER_13288 [Lithospermum erythrorhizon]|uniref:Integrase catalytic domain-containing protein n=1 Tax=Lithospermum erythrorhizon TaxID=34254 RepID=A0AAV3Q045_LITER
MAVDYISKWIEESPLKKTKGENVTHFLWKNTVTRFGIRKVLVSHNRPQFEGKILADFCEKFGIEHRFAPVHYPQLNGQVEVMNRIIFKEIKKNLLQSGKSGGRTYELDDLEGKPIPRTWHASKLSKYYV